MKENRERGAVTVEASMALVTFMFLIMTILMIVDICVVQERIGCAINATAKEISQYSYLYGLTGLNTKKKALANGAEPAKQDINTATGAVSGIFDAVGSMQNTATSVSADPSTWQDTYSNLQNDAQSIKDNAGELKKLAEKIKDDPKAFIYSIAKLAGSELVDIATSKLIAEPVSRAMVQKHLRSSDDQSTEDYLRSLHIVPDATGSYLGGLDFSESTLFLYGSDEINIIVKYKVKLVSLLPIERIYTFRQVAITKGWLGGDGNKSMSPQQAMMEENTSLWRADIEGRSGFMIDQAGSELEKKGYYGTTGSSRRYFYNPEENSMYTVATSNLMYEHYSASEITDAEIKEMMRKAAANQSAEWPPDRTDVRYKTKDNKNVDYEIPSDPPLQRHLMLVIPEDDGLLDRITQYLSEHPEDKYGFEVEYVQSYGKGAPTVEAENPPEQNGDGDSSPAQGDNNPGTEG